MLWLRERIEAASPVAPDSREIVASGRGQAVWLCTVGLEKRKFFREILRAWPLRGLPRRFGVSAGRLPKFETRLQHRDLY
jgi:hypothetical protein